jgi:hypothetical protein
MMDATQKRLLFVLLACAGMLVVNVIFVFSGVADTLYRSLLSGACAI